MKTTIIIPTYKRPESLGKTLDSILENTLQPDELIIIDDDALESNYIEQWRSQFEKKHVIFRYHKKDHSIHRRGLSESKNLAIDLATHEIIFYLDDDVVLDSKYLSELMSIWNEHNETNLAMVGGKISNNRTQSNIERIFNKLFGLTGESSWDVNSVGFQVWNQSIAKTQRAHYLHGGVSSYKKSILAQYKFPEFSGGRTGLEDVALCLQLKQNGYHGYYVPSAQLAHYHEPSGREDPVAAGEKETRNRIEIFLTHVDQTFKHRIWFGWAMTGWIIKKILSRDLKHSWGMIRGLMK